MNRKKGEIEIFIFLIGAALLLIAGLFFSGKGITGGAPLGGIGSCGTPIIDNSDLIGDVGPCAGNGVVFGADNLILDCHGFKIYGSNTGRGILADSRKNVTIKNCVVANFTSGILLNKTNSSFVLNNYAYNNSDDGIYLRAGSNNNTVMGNNVSFNKWGMTSEASVYNNFSNNIAINNDDAGIMLYRSNFTSVGSNRVDFNGNNGPNYWTGIYLYSAHNNSIYVNNLTLNNNAIWLDGSHNNTIFSNRADQNIFGIQLTGLTSPRDNLIYNNLFNGSDLGYDDDGTKNKWNTSYNCSLGPNIIGGSCLGGNYWSDYIGADNGLGSYPYNTSGDTIGDMSLPYNSGGNINGGGDYLPLTNRLINCPHRLNYSLILTENLTAGNGVECINITGDNVVLDCAGYSIHKTSYDFQMGINAINIVSRRNVTIKNCQSNNFHDKINIQNSTNITLENVNLGHGGGEGGGMALRAENSSYVQIIDSRIDDYYLNYLFNITFIENSTYGGKLFYPGNLSSPWGYRWLIGPFSSPPAANPIIKISHNNVAVDSVSDGAFNISAELTLYALTFNNPIILRDGAECPSNICTKIDYSSGTLIFNVTEFTNYSAAEGPVPNLTVAKTDSADPVQPGDNFVYQIIINNTGTANATNVTVTETYPTDFIFVNASPGANATNNTWYFSLANGSSTTINITVQVNASAAAGAKTNSLLVNYSDALNNIYSATASENTTVNIPSATTPASGGGGGSSSREQCRDSKDNDGDGLIDYPNDPGCVNLYDRNETDSTCQQSWTCSEWGACTIGQQKRTCHEENQCQQKLASGQIDRIIEIGKPEEKKACVVPASCADGVQNQNEEGIDCGGLCSPCPQPILPAIETPVEIKHFSWPWWLLLIILIALLTTGGIAEGIRIHSLRQGKRIGRLIDESLLLIKEKNIPALHLNYLSITKKYDCLRHKEKEIFYPKILALHKKIENMKF